MLYQDEDLLSEGKIGVIHCRTTQECFPGSSEMPQTPPFDPKKVMGRSAVD